MDDPEKQTQQQLQRGCHGKAIAPFRLDSDDLDRCPVRLVEWERVRPILDLWQHLLKGRYPCDGGYADQPALFMDLLGEVEGLVREMEQEKINRG
jgi:hypothetical protein